MRHDLQHGEADASPGLKAMKMELLAICLVVAIGIAGFVVGWRYNDDDIGSQLVHAVIGFVIAIGLAAQVVFWIAPQKTSGITYDDPTAPVDPCDVQKYC